MNLNKKTSAGVSGAGTHGIASGANNKRQWHRMHKKRRRTKTQRCHCEPNATTSANGIARTTCNVVFLRRAAVIYPWILLSIMLSFYTSVDQIIPFPSQRSMIAPIRWIAGTMQALSKMVLKVSCLRFVLHKKKRETQAPQGDP